MSKDLPVPQFFNSANAADWHYVPNQANVRATANDWRKSFNVKPAASDAFKLQVLLIDVQKDFCLPPISNGTEPGGTLYVGGRSGSGAIDDTKRTAEWIYRNLARITNIACTMDTHFAYQIFFPSFWLDQDDKSLSPFREVFSEEVASGKVKPNPAVAHLVGGNYGWLVQQCAYYCKELEKQNKYKLYLWPEHCILGSDGHTLVGSIHEATLFHSFTRGAQSDRQIKGGNLLTENYSVLRPEVLTRFDGKPLAQKNTAFIEQLLKSDAVVIAGQAASHCVLSSIDDLLNEIHTQDPKLASKVYVMTDCMSAVTVPDGKGGFFADFTQNALDAQAKFANAGMHLVKSTDSIESWPGLKI